MVLTFRIEYVAGTHWTGMDENGSLTGTGAQLLNNEGDILLSFSTEILPYRVEKLSCSHPVVSHRYLTSNIALVCLHAAVTRAGYYQ